MKRFRDCETDQEKHEWLEYTRNRRRQNEFLLAEVAVYVVTCALIIGLIWMLKR